MYFHPSRELSFGLKPKSCYFDSVSESNGMLLWSRKYKRFGFLVLRLNYGILDRIINRSIDQFLFIKRFSETERKTPG